MKKGRVALYPGSFDPVTNGHLDIIERSLLVFDRLVVGVAENTSKTALFTAQERTELLKKAIPKRLVGSLEIVQFEGLTVQYAKTIGAVAIVRGLRVVSDFENEFQIALMNRRLDPTVHTMFFMTSFSNVFVSSTIIKEICKNGGKIDQLVPGASARALERRFAELKHEEQHGN